MGRLLLIHSEKHDPWMNLALEEHLVRLLQADVVQAGSLCGILYLWQNQNTVVIGRNQNAWTECQTGLLESEGGQLARRTTGGGAVYHDLGNLNFSLIMPRRTFSLDDNFALITSAVNAQGIHAERSGRNDVLAEGRKFSGNAFGLLQDVGLHHGTLLIDSDYGRLARYLTVSASKLQAKGIASVKSRVINLRELKPEITVTGMAQAMEDSFCQRYAANNQIIRAVDADYQDDPQLHDLYHHFASWSWRYGQSIKFNARIDHRFVWGHLDIGLVIEEGLIRQAVIYSDALDSDFIEALAFQLEGCRFQSAALVAALSGTPAQDVSFG
ncbi:MAG TPA: lipoate--protein ligase, partial [Clostridiales bacterium]|nr:lipoate--protein ligase [Clostridiales bacterium]